jgi:hypothetical protein
MDELIGFIVLLIIFSLLDKVLRGQKGRAQRPPPEEGREARDDEREAVEESSASLRELLAEELGLNLERRPTVKELPEARSLPAGRDRADAASVVDRGGAPSTRRPVSATPPEIEQVIHYPTPKRPERKPERVGASQSGYQAAEERKRATAVRRRRAPLQTPRREERLPSERGEAVTLERLRRPEDHQRFHDRYGVPQPVASHEEFHARYVEGRGQAEPRKGDIILPDSPDWSDVQRAIIWSEILGPPRGLG